MSENKAGSSEQNWPKPWVEIKPDLTNQFAALEDGYIEFMDGLRGYDGTLYASVDLGSDTDDNRDLWLPFNIYIERQLNTNN